MLKALSAIEIPLGRDREVMFAHSAKAPSFMNVAAEAMMTSLRLLQRRKALIQNGKLPKKADRKEKSIGKTIKGIETISSSWRRAGGRGGRATCI